LSIRKGKKKKKNPKHKPTETMTHPARFITHEKKKKEKKERLTYKYLKNTQPSQKN